MNIYELIEKNTIYGDLGRQFTEEEYSYIPEKHHPYFKKHSLKSNGSWEDTIPMPTPRGRRIVHTSPFSGREIIVPTSGDNNSNTRSNLDEAVTERLMPF